MIIAGIVILLTALVFAIEYHGRGGSFFVFGNGTQPHLFGIDPTYGWPYFKYGSTTAARICWWALPVTFETFWLISTFSPQLLLGVASWMLWTIFIAYFLMLYVALLIFSHGPFMSFGTHVTTSANWICKILPSYTLDDPKWKRELIDFSGLTITGILRGVIQCMPLLFLSTNFWVIIVGQGLLGVGYFLGYKVLQNFKPAVGFDDPCSWGELFTGFFYGLFVALVVFL